MKMAQLLGPIPIAAADVIAERKRQIEQEGFDTFHDDAHLPGVLADAGAAYAHSAAARLDSNTEARRPVWWPFDLSWWKPKSSRQDLVRAAALIIAEIERIDRVAERNAAH